MRSLYVRVKGCGAQKRRNVTRFARASILNCHREPGRSSAMSNDADKIAAATLAAAMLRRLEPTGSIQEDARVRDLSIRFADRLYRDILAAIQAPNPEPAAAAAAPASGSPEAPEARPVPTPEL